MLAAPMLCTVSGLSVLLVKPTTNRREPTPVIPMSCWPFDFVASEDQTLWERSVPAVLHSSSR